MNERDKFLKIILANLERINYNEYMELCYNMIVTFPENVLAYDDVTAKHKLESLDKMISHFEEMEEYEKCSKINSIKKIITDEQL